LSCFIRIIDGGRVARRRALDRRVLPHHCVYVRDRHEDSDPPTRERPPTRGGRARWPFASHACSAVRHGKPSRAARTPSEPAGQGARSMFGAGLPCYVHRASWHDPTLTSALLAHRFTSATQRVADDREEPTLVVAPAPNLQFPARVLDFDSRFQSARTVGSLAAKQ
jgi:hypothetical protein